MHVQSITIISDQQSQLNAKMLHSAAELPQLFDVEPDDVEILPEIT
jgi:hypothetical protein